MEPKEIVIGYDTMRRMAQNAVDNYKHEVAAAERAKVEAAAKEKAQIERDNDQWFKGYINGVAGGVILMTIGFAVAYILTH